MSVKILLDETKYDDAQQSSFDNASFTENLSGDIFQIAREGDVSALHRYIAVCANNAKSIKKKLNSRDSDRITPLHLAARYNKYDMVKYLIKNGANPQKRDNEGLHPLHYAAKYKRIKLISMQKRNENIDRNSVTFEQLYENLIKPTMQDSVIIFIANSGGDVNAEDIYGCTPLHYAAIRCNEYGTVELLLCMGIDIEHKDHKDMRPVHLAISHNSLIITKLLLKRDANILCKDEDNGTPIHFAAMEGSMSIMLEIVDRAERLGISTKDLMADPDNEHNTALMLSVENRNYDCAKYCLELGAKVNMQKFNGTTALHLAASNGEKDLCDLLIQYKARIDAFDNNMQTPLHKAAQNGNSEISQFLIDNGANLEKRDCDNFTPFLVAASYGHVETIKIFLINNVNIEAIDRDDKSALFWAAQENNVAALEILLKTHCAECLMDMTDKSGDSPLHVAASKGYIDIVNILISHKADTTLKNEDDSTPIHLAAASGHVNVVRRIAEYNKSSVKDENEDSDTPLHLAATCGHIYVVKCLLEHGAPVDATNTKMWTALDCAADNGWTKTCKVLIESDSPIDPKDRSDQTPLLLASMKGHITVIDLLLKSGANVNKRDNAGSNCLDLAINHNQEEVALYFINSEFWEDVLQWETYKTGSERKITTFRKLIHHMPDVALKVLDRCIETDNKYPSDHINYCVTFNWKYIDDTFQNWKSQRGSDAGSSLSGSIDGSDKDSKKIPMYTENVHILKNNHPLCIMSRSKREKLLTHPVITTLLNQKWNSFAKYVYYLNLFIYCLFCFFVNGFILSSEYKADYTCDTIYPYEMPQYFFIFTGKYILYVFICIMILREIAQLFKEKLRYLSFENAIEWIIFILVLLFISDFSFCPVDTGYRQFWQWQICPALALLLTWVELLLFMRKLAKFGIYIVMFTEILETFFEFFPIFSIAIIAFSVTFYVLLSNVAGFTTIWLSLVRVLVLLIGEFDFTSMFYDEVNPIRKEHITTSYIIFVIFVITMTILLSNLLVGLAVDDIKAVQEQANLKRLSMQIDLTMDVENFLHVNFRRYFIKSKFPIYPHKRKGIFWSIFSYNITVDSITRQLNPELNKIEQLQDEVNDIHESIAKLRYRMKDVQVTNENISAMLKKLLTKSEINYSDLN